MKKKTPSSSTMKKSVQRHGRVMDAMPMRLLTSGDVRYAVAGFSGPNSARDLFACRSRPTNPVQSKPTILTPLQLRGFMTLTTDPEVLIGIALAAFAGLRISELKRLRWEDVIPDLSIHIASNFAKRRLVPILPVLDEWLQPFYGSHGSVLPKHVLRKIRLIASKVCNIKLQSFRRSYGTYRMALTGLESTCHELGYNPSLFPRLHRSLVTREAARQYFALTPGAISLNNWNQSQ